MPKLMYDDKNYSGNASSSGGGVFPHLIVISETGSTVTATKGSTTITARETSTDHFECDLVTPNPQDTYGTWVIHAILNGDDAQANLVVDAVKVYTVDDEHFHADIIVTYPDGAVVSCTKDGLSPMYATSSPYTFTVHSIGMYTISGEKDGITEIVEVDIVSNGQTENVTLDLLPDGKTITPTDNIQILLHCADIDNKSYTTISELLADDTTLLKVLTHNNSIDYLVRSTTYASSVTADSDAMAMIGSYDYASDTLLADSTWATAIAGSTYAESVVNVKVPAMTSNTTPSGVCSASSSFQSYDPYKAFDNNWTSSGWTVSGSNTSGWVQYEFPSVVTIHAFKYKYIETGSPANPTWQMKGSNDGTNFTNIGSSVSDLPTNTIVTESVSNSTSYKYIRMDGTASTGMSAGQGYKFQFYGRKNGGVQTWLRSGGITDKTYTTLAEVLADTTTLSALISNHDAVDYLVTAKAFIDGIVADATAMSYIGLNNYCANTLLADADWCNGICNSTYFESVLNVKVPTMTSNTTPSGECWQENPSTNPTYYAFDGNVSTSTNDNAYTIPVRIGYSFPNAKKIFKTVANIARILTGKIQGSNDKTTWYDIADYTGTSSQTEQSIVSSSNIEEYKHYAIQCLTSSATGQYAKMIVTELQFYGRENV